MAQFLQQLRTRVKVGVVGGSDLKKIKEQLGEDGKISPVCVFILLVVSNLLARPASSGSGMGTPS